MVLSEKNVLIAEPLAERRLAMATVLRRMDANIIEATDGQQALGAINNQDLNLVLCAEDIGSPGADDIYNYIQDFGAGKLPFILLAGEIPGSGRESNATLVLPYSTGPETIEGACKLLLGLHAAEKRVNRLQEENEELRKSMREVLHPDPETRLHRFDLFKQVIVMEVKKARRYDFPLSMLLLAIDKYKEMAGWLNPKQRSGLFGLLHRTLVNDIRDIDIPVLFAEQKILVVMPHTSLEGAAVVADRIRGHVDEIEPPRSLTRLSLTVSVAVASTEGQDEISFGKMVGKAVRGLGEAALKGGNIVIVCRSKRTNGESSGQMEPGGKLGPRTFFV